MLYEHELLEALLFNACPRKDLNAVAHALINRFGSVNGVMSATERQLSEVDGVGENMAQYLVTLSSALSRSSGANCFAHVKNTSQFLEYVRTRPLPEDINCRIEVCFVDKDGRMRRKYSFDEKEKDFVALSSNEVLKALTVSRPYGVFAIEERRSSGCDPCGAGDEAVKAISEACSLCGVRFYDYCILSEGGETFSYFLNDRHVAGVKPGWRE